MSQTRVLADSLSLSRVMRDLRVSVTDRCSFRCLYCLPETAAAASFYRTSAGSPPAASRVASRSVKHLWKPRSEMLSFEEIHRLVRLAVTLGVRKVRLTGGEPLLRQDLPTLVEKLAGIADLQDLAMTTNGFGFAAKAQALRAAGLKRVSFSLDSIVRETFRKITGHDGLAEVLAGIRLAKQLGLTPVKVNVVVIRGWNDREVESLAEFAHTEQLALRFVEFMPLNAGGHWQRRFVVPGREILARLRARFALQPILPVNPAETARRWAFADGCGEVGIIAAVTEPFCDRCNRLRLTADGKIRTCLFSLVEHDVKALLRGGATDDQIAEALQAIAGQKEPGHRIAQPEFASPRRTMSSIGG